MYLRKGNRAGRAMTELLRQVEELKPYIYHQATTGSKYIKFNDEMLRSVRIADHSGKEKYKYKWNLRVDKRKCSPWMELDEGIERYYYPADAVCKLAQDLRYYDGHTPRRFKCGLSLTAN